VKQGGRRVALSVQVNEREEDVMAVARKEAAFLLRAGGRVIATAETLADARAAAVAVVQQGHPVVEIVDTARGEVVEVGELGELGDIVFFGGELWEAIDQ
jgi:hypothetical protein